jgi:hypothetical protein
VFTPAAAATAAVAAVGVPLLIHLLFRKRYQIVPWAAVRFLLVAERRHRRRIDHWGLLALRTLALLLPLFAMLAVTDPAERLWQRIKPGSPQTVANTPRTHHVLVVDVSLSMTARTDDGRTRFDLAVDKAEALVRNANPGDGFTLIALAATPRTVVEGPSNEPDKVIDELHKLKPTHGTADAAAALTEGTDRPDEKELARTVGDVLGRSPRAYPRRQVTVFSDLQAATWARAVPQGKSDTDDQKVRDAWKKVFEQGKADVAVIDVARAAVENLAVTDLTLADPLALTDTPVVVQAAVQNFGRVERRRVQVELLLARPSASGADAFSRVDQVKVIDALPPGGRAAVTFVLDGPHRFRDRGVHVLQAALVKDAGFSGDDLPADDTRALAVEVRDGLHVALIDGRASLPVLQRGATHLAWALHPPGLPLSATPARLFHPADPPTDREERWVVSPEQLAGRAPLRNPRRGDLTGADCIFLCDVPNPSPELVARLEAHLKRGGGLVIGLGPNAAASRDAYDRLLFNDGKGILPGPLGDAVLINPAPTPDVPFALPGFQLAGTDEAFRRPPLAAFQADDDRAGLTSVLFHGYVRLDAPPDGRARRLLSFVPALELPPMTPGWSRRAVLFRLGYPSGPADPAAVEWPRHRGRVVVYTTTFHPDPEWNEWAIDQEHRTFLPFVHQLMRFASANPDRHTVKVGEPVDEYFPAATDEKAVGVTGPEGLSATVPLVPQDEALLAHFSDTRLSGVYRLGAGAARDRTFAVTIPESSPTGKSESDLMDRVDPAQLRSVGPVQVVADPSEVKPGADPSAALVVTKPKPWGPGIARAAVLLALLVLTAELIVAWRLGPARSAAARAARPPERRRRWVGWLATPAALLPLAVAGVALFVVAHAELTGNLLGFLPEAMRQRVEAAFGVPPAAPGEGTHWRLEWFTTFLRAGTLERAGAPSWAGVVDLWVRVGLAAFAGILTVATYVFEGRAGSFLRLIPAAFLRAGTFAAALFLLLPQVQLTFDREGLPEVVILIDTSASMATEEDFRDPAVRARAEELFAGNPPPRLAEAIRDWEREWADEEKAAKEAEDRWKKDAEAARREGRPDPPRPVHRPKPDLTRTRLKLVQLLLTRGDPDWLTRLARDKRVRVSVYAVDRGTRRVSAVDELTDVPDANREIWKLNPTGDVSELGDGVEAVLQRYQGRSLAGVVMFTDGVTTNGSDLPGAARKAAQAGVPLYLVGVGDAWEPPDLALSDLQVEDVVTQGDNLVFTVRLTARGQVPPDPVTVILCEKRPNPNDEPQRAGDPGVLAQVTVNPDPSGNPVTVRLNYTPQTAGRKTFVLKVPPVPEEVTLANNRVERSVLVTKAQHVRVLYVEGRPRYDFRFAKVLFERESRRVTGENSFEVHVVLLGAAPDWPDPVALTAFPTREQLFKYDVVILGDFDKAMLERQFAGETKPADRARHALQDLADFVRVRGGGMMVLSGENAGPAAFADTPLADVLPVEPTGPAQKPTTEDRPLTEGYRPRLTPAGARHPMFRFRPDEAESAKIWDRLPPLYWYARGYKRKPAAEVLAVHPDRPAEAAGPTGRAENHPLVLQQFVGNGRVIYLGFDDTWRWRLRNDEEQFDRFWLQAVRVLARSRVGRIELRTDKQTPYREGERMVVIARFPDDAPAPPKNQVVRVRWVRSPLSGPGGTTGPGTPGDGELVLTRPTPEEAGRKPEDERTFQHVLTGVAVGDYRFELIEPETEDRPRAEAKVLPPPDERTQVALNKPDLIAAATLSDGRFYTLADAERVFDDLRNLDPVPLDQPRPPVTFWDHPLTYALFLFLLMAEWLLRKRERLL